MAVACCAATAFGHPVQQREWDYVAKHAPDGWREQKGLEKLEDDGEFDDVCNVDNVSHKRSKKSWARLIAKLYDTNPLICPKCSSEMKVIAIIFDNCEIRKILKHLVKSGKAPPGLDEDILN